MKIILFLAALLTLIACSGDDSDNIVGAHCGQIDPLNDIIINVDDSYGSVEIRDTTDVAVTASRSTRTILEGSPIGDLYIAGNNNLLTFESNVTVEYICITGADNSIRVPAGSGVTVDRDSGSGNLVIEY